MSQLPPPNNPTDEVSTLEEQLVAYLDQELDEESSRRIEQLLAADPKVRETLRQLEQTWEAIGQLEHAEVDDAFTRTTLEMVAVSVSDEISQQQQQVSRRRLRGWFLGASGLAAAAAAGFLATAWLRPDPNGLLLRDLPVIENLDEYRQIDDLEFLRMLRDASLFAEEAGDGA